ncbi:MAG: hypothetical protein ACRCTZ_21830 [Sarcina sp.]
MEDLSNVLCDYLVNNGLCKEGECDRCIYEEAKKIVDNLKDFVEDK